MRVPQRLDERPFNIKDGKKYIILVNVSGINLVYCGKMRYNESKDMQMLSKTFINARVFHTLKLAEKTAYKDLIEHDYRDWTIIQVKDIFEPRYLVKYVKRVLYMDGRIDVSLNWYIIGDHNVNTYTDYNGAMDALRKCKAKLVEDYYRIITTIRDIKLPEIENGTP